MTNGIEQRFGGHASEVTQRSLHLVWQQTAFSSALCAAKDNKTAGGKCPAERWVRRKAQLKRA